MKFFERFALELEGCGMTQSELAEKLNMDKSNITNWKQGKYVPSLETFYELCKILDVSADYLLGLKD